MYFLCAASGKTRWVFKTGDAVKSCPAVDPLTGLVIVGSHDGRVYATNPEVSALSIKRCKGSDDSRDLYIMVVSRSTLPKQGEYDFNFNLKRDLLCFFFTPFSSSVFYRFLQR